MNKIEIEQILNSEIASIESFENWHGITPGNLAHYLVPPYEVLVDPDDGGQTEPRIMWVVLHERAEPIGYLVAYDPFLRAWAVLEKKPEAMSEFVQITSAGSLAEALESM